MSFETGNVCQALDAVEEDMIEILQTSIVGGAKPNISIYKDKLRRLRKRVGDYFECPRPKDIEKGWSRVQRLAKTGTPIY